MRTADPMASAARRFSVAARDRTVLRGVRLGAGDGVPIVLCHGLGMSISSWGDVPAILARHHPVAAFDLRGHGASAPARADGYALETLAGDLDVVLRAVAPPDRGGVLAGHSLGGGILLAHAHACGIARTHALAFVATSGSAQHVPRVRSLGGGERAVVRAAWLHALRGTLRMLRPLGARLRAARMLTRVLGFGSDAADGDVRLLHRLVVDNDPDAVARTIDAILAVDPTAWAGAARRPARVLLGGDDRLTSRDDVRALATALPDAQVRLVEGAGHMLPISHPGAVARELADLALSPAATG